MSPEIKKSAYRIELDFSNITSEARDAVRMQCPNCPVAAVNIITKAEIGKTVFACSQLDVSTARVLRCRVIPSAGETGKEIVTERIWPADINSIRQKGLCFNSTP